MFKHGSVTDVPCLSACVCGFTGLLAGMWELPGVLTEEGASAAKQKKALCAEMGKTLGVQLDKQPLEFVGEVSSLVTAEGNLETTQILHYK